MMKLTTQLEDRIINGGLIIFWSLFWLLNVIDKFATEATLFWVGKDRMGQLTEMFASIGVDANVAMLALTVVTFLEVIAATFALSGLYYYFKKDKKNERSMFFWSIFTGLIIFSFFAIGDQIFGDRVELLEHTTYWVALIVSWGAYEYFPKKK